MEKIFLFFKNVFKSVQRSVNIAYWGHDTEQINLSIWFKWWDLLRWIDCCFKVWKRIETTNMDWNLYEYASSRTNFNFFLKNILSIFKPFLWSFFMFYFIIRQQHYSLHWLISKRCYSFMFLFFKFFIRFFKTCYVSKIISFKLTCKAKIQIICCYFLILFIA